MAADRSVFAFSPDGMLWKVCRERCGLLDGPAAAVMQVAHPKIAAGVRDHSDFQKSPLDRLKRTLSAVNSIAFGTVEEATRVAQRVTLRHRAVRGPGYSADEPELLMWVIATLIMAAVNGYERALGKLTPAELESFYTEMRVFGTYFGLPTTHGPQCWTAFCDYWARMVIGPLLGSDPVTREVAWAVARPARPWWFAILSHPSRFLFSEVIPSPVRERLGFRSTLLTRASMSLATAFARLLVPRLPSVFRFAPEYRRAIRRMRKAAP